MKRPFEILEHTADVGFRAVGGTVGELFENAAAALMSFTSGKAGGGSGREVRLEGDSYESLLYNWLSEVLYLFDSGILAPSRFRVEEISATSLRATIGGAPRAGQSWLLIVKAVTYHQLEVKEADGRWEATVYLDV